MNARRATGVLSLLAALAAAVLAGVTVTFFSSGRSNTGQFQASPDFAVAPQQGSSHTWAGFADFSIGLSDTAPTTVNATTVLALARQDPDQTAAPVAGALSPTIPGALAQTFTPGADQTLGRVDLVLSAVGVPEDVTLSIRSAAGGVPVGADLATATIPATAIPVGADWVLVTMTAPPTLVATQVYAIVLEGAGVAWQLAADYPAGNAASSLDGVAFVARADDLAFATRVATGGPFVTLGQQTSAPFDLGAPGPDQFIVFTWLANLPTGTAARFQLAVSNQATDTAMSTFLGPDGTAATFYETAASPLWFGLNGKRFIRYQVTLTTTDPALSPELESASVTWDRRPPEPTNLQPAGTATATPTFTWSATDPDGDTLTYLFQLSRDNTFTATVEQRVNLKVASHSLTAPLEPGTYWWRVASFDGVLQGDWSGAAQITVP